MATLEQQLFAALYGDAGVSGLVGGNIYGGLMPRNGPMPAIMYNRISTERSGAIGSYTLDRGYTGFCRVRVQIDCESDDYNQAVMIAEAVRLVVMRLDFTGGGNSRANRIAGERDLSMPNQAAQFCRSLDALIWFVEEGRDG